MRRFIMRALLGARGFQIVSDALHTYAQTEHDLNWAREAEDMRARIFRGV